MCSRPCGLLSSLLFLRFRRRPGNNCIAIASGYCICRDEPEGGGGLCAIHFKSQLPARQNNQAPLHTTESRPISHIRHTHKQNQLVINMSDTEEEHCPYPLPTDSHATRNLYHWFRWHENDVSESYADMLETGLRLRAAQAQGTVRRIAWAALRLARLQIRHERLEATMDEAEMAYLRASRADRRLPICCYAFPLN